MLNVPNHMLSLRSTNHRRDHLPRENRILAHILKRPPVARLASQVHASAEGHVVTLRAQLASDQRSVFIASIEVPTRRRGQIARQSCGVAAILPAIPYPVGCVRHLDRGDSETRNAHRITRASVRMYGQRTDRAEILHARPMQQEDLLVNRHLLYHQGGALIRRKTRIRPWGFAGRFRLRRGWRRYNTDGDDTEGKQAHCAQAAWQIHDSPFIASRGTVELVC